MRDRHHGLPTAARTAPQGGVAREAAQHLTGGVDSSRAGSVVRRFGRRVDSGRVVDNLGPHLDGLDDIAHLREETLLAVIAPPAFASVEINEMPASPFGQRMPFARGLSRGPNLKFLCHASNPSACAPSAPSTIRSDNFEMRRLTDSTECRFVGRNTKTNPDRILMRMREACNSRSGPSGNALWTWPTFLFFERNVAEVHRLEPQTLKITA